MSDPVDDDTDTGTPTRSDEMPAPPNPQRSWLPAIMVAICLLVLLVGVAWWYTHLEAPPTLEGAVDAIAEFEQDEEPAAPTEPAAVATAPTSTVPAPAPAADPTNCIFINGNRPQVDEKYVLTCNEGQFRAKAEYRGEGVFVFSAFERYTP